LPYPVQFTLSRWIGGEDVRHSMPRRTFYWHRRKILDELGLDISLRYEKEQAEAVVFDLDYLKEHEIKLLPSQLQGLLFKPEPSPRWEKS
jgi:Phage X family.